MNKPLIVFADEPTANLDEENLYIMIEFIKQLKINYNMSFLIATHDERLRDIADNIFYIKNRKLTRINT